jgi:hypothetical protein
LLDLIVNLAVSGVEGLVPLKAPVDGRAEPAHD